MTILKTLIPGGGGDYTLVSQAEADDQQTLSEPYVLECYAGTINDSWDWRDWGTSAANNITVRAAPGHENKGVIGAGFISNYTGPTSTAYLTIQSYITYKDITLENSNTGTRFVVGFGNARTEIVYENCIILRSAGSGNVVNVESQTTAGTSKRFINCLLHSVVLNVSANTVTQGVISFLNCDILSDTYAILGSAGSNLGIDFANCVIWGELETLNPASTITTISGADYCAFKAGNTAYGSNQIIGLVDTTGVDFVNFNADDFNAVPTGSLDEAGENLYSLFQTDIKGDARPDSGLWTVGAYGIEGTPPVGVQEMYIKDGGIFVKYTPYVKVGGTFQEVDAYVLEGGTWVPVHEK